MRGRPRARLDDVVWLEDWEATFLLEAAREAEVGPEAIALLEARAAEWASRKALRLNDPDLGPYATLLDGVLVTLDAVRTEFDEHHGDAVATVEARLLDLKKTLQFPDPAAAIDDIVVDPIGTELDIADLILEDESLDDDIDLALLESIDDIATEPSFDLSSDDLPVAATVAAPVIVTTLERVAPTAVETVARPPKRAAAKTATAAPRRRAPVIPIAMAAVAAMLGAVLFLI